MTRNSKLAPTRKAPNLAASWSLDDWPADIWPNAPERGRYIVRAYRTSLLTAGALARVGRELIVFGAKYQRWLEMHASNVPGYVAVANLKIQSAPAQTA